VSGETNVDRRGGMMEAKIEVLMSATLVRGDAFCRWRLGRGSGIEARSDSAFGLVCG
jgi:hypothetical protein